MPMATEPTSAARRRWLAAAAAAWLARHGVSAAAPRDSATTSATTNAITANATAASPLLATAWNDARGRHFVGLLALSGARVHVDASIEVPTRAHAIAVEPGGAVLAVARRPGDWLLRWHPRRAAARGAAQWQWSGDERCFTGHTLRSPDGRHLFTAETDLRSGAGLLVQRDADSLSVLREWPTRGSDPHDLQWLPSGRLLVANGGISTLPETGRAKRALDTMDSSIVEIDPREDEPGPALRLPDPRLSLRHLALHPTGQVAIALQAEHDEPADRAQAPVLALYDPATQALRSVLQAPMLQAPLLQGYGGDVAALPGGWVVSCPRVGQLAFFDLDGSWQGQQPLADACALAESGSQAWAVGSQAVIALGGVPVGPCHVAGLQIDNHAVVWPHRPAPG
jgi:uncharacterized protein